MFASMQELVYVEFRKRCCMKFEKLISNYKWRFFYKREWKIIPQISNLEEFNWKDTFIKRYTSILFILMRRYRWWTPNRTESSELCISRFRVSRERSHFIVTDHELISADSYRNIVKLLSNPSHSFSSSWT